MEWLGTVDRGSLSYTLKLRAPPPLPLLWQRSELIKLQCFIKYVKEIGKEIIGFEISV
jgi:hypothetical protein